jgi:hypothetical protein
MSKVEYFKLDCIPTSIQIFTNIINASSTFMNAYFELWKIIKMKKDYKLLLIFSYYMIGLSHDEEVTFDDWIKAYILYARALFLNERKDDAIQLLRSLLDIFSNIPLDEIKFLSEIHKSNKITTTNNLFNFDRAIRFYSKYHVYKKCEGIFLLHNKSRSNRTKISFNEERKINSDLRNLDYKTFHRKLTDYDIINTEFDNSKDPIYLNHSAKHCEIKVIEENIQIKDLKIDTLKSLEEFIENNLENINIPEENTCIILFK